MKVDKLTRFTGRASYYAKHRPCYPDTVIRVLSRQAGWNRDATVADIGAGTGISSELFLRHGNTVWGVEPNADMRAQSIPVQSRYPGFQMLDTEARRYRTQGCNEIANHVHAATDYAGMTSADLHTDRKNRSYPHCGKPRCGP